MRRSFGLLIGAAVALTALGGCDERDDDRQGAKTEKQGVAAPTLPSGASPSSRLGVGWHAAADTRLSVWGFVPKPLTLRGGILAAQSNAPAIQSDEGVPADALAAIRAALMARMLPARSSIRIEELVNRASASIEPTGYDNTASRPTAILATTPWNDDTMLMWVEIPGLIAADGATISIEFDPRTVAAFRTLGDPSALPSPTRMPGGGISRAAMIYELSPQAGGKTSAPKTTTQYAVLHVGSPLTTDGAPKLDQPVTAADAVGTIDNAPDVVRLAAAAAGFGELLRGDPAVRDLSCNDVIALAQSVQRPDPDGWRARLIALMYRAQPLIDLPPNESAK